MATMAAAEDEEASATLLAIDEDEIEAGRRGNFEEEEGSSMCSLNSLLAGDEAMLADT